MSPRLTPALLLLAAALHAGEPDPACRADAAAHQRAIAALKTDCTADADCASTDADWNPCRGPVASRADDDQGRRAVGAARKKAHESCRFVMPPCPAAPGRPVCVKGVCRNATRVSSVEVVLRGARGRRLAGILVALSSGEMRQTRKTDAEGRLPVEHLLFYGEELTVAPDGHEPRSLSWSELVKADALRFRPETPGGAP